MNIIPSATGDIDVLVDMFFLYNFATPLKPKLLSVGNLSHNFLAHGGSITHAELEEELEDQAGAITDIGGAILEHTENSEIHTSLELQGFRSGFLTRFAGLVWTLSTTTLSWTSFALQLPLCDINLSIQSPIVLPSVGDYGYIDLLSGDPTRPLAASPTSYTQEKNSHIVFCRRSNAGIVYVSDGYIAN